MARKAKQIAAAPPPEAYAPTEKEAAALAAHHERLAARPPRPKMKTTVKCKANGTAEAKIEIDHKDPTTGGSLLDQSMGSTDWAFTRMMIAEVAGLSTSAETLDAAKSRDDKVFSGHLAIVQALAPQNELECMLAVQMAAVHTTTLAMACSMRMTTNADRREQLERSMSRLARTFTTQMEALKRQRSKGEQKVIVEHVTVNEGGQAIVGNVGPGGGGHD